MNLILLLDTSSSIKEKKPGALIDAAQNIIQMFQSLCSLNKGFEGYIGSMCFGEEVAFFPLKQAADFTLVDTDFKGDTRMGLLFKTLSEELSSSYLLSSTGDYKNILVLLSDGGITDVLSDGFIDVLNNPAFINSRRIAVSVGNRINKAVLSSFCSFSSDLFKAEDIEPVNEILRYTIDKLVLPKPSLQYERRLTNDTEWD